jgi:uncharacterized protein GlcG (DUF336 family)
MAWGRLQGVGLGMALALVAGCGGGSGPSTTGTAPPVSGPSQGCSGSCASAASFLTQSDVSTILAQAVAEAQANNTPATIAVVDRVGNVLGVYRMTGSPVTVTIHSERPVTGGLENLIVPSELAAIAKALTGAYLSSEGNAFTTRTASQIVQQNFNPGETNAPSGPLFGVQFSQLPCSDFMTRFTSGQPIGAGPHRSPLGLSADPGGFPLYKDGVPVGGIGVAADPDYTLDARISDRDRDIDELIALAGTFGFGAPADRRADRITVDGKTFRYSDVEYSDLARAAGTAPALSTLPATVGKVIRVPAYAEAQIRAGTAFGTAASGVRPADSELSDLDAFVIVDNNNSNRFAVRGGTEGNSSALSAAEVRTLLREALKVANRARAQIRQPLGTQARVSISVVDTNGEILAIARTRDAPIFGLDVSLQKARTAAFYSNAVAAVDLQSLPDAVYLNASLDSAGVQFRTVESSSISAYVTAVRDFLGLPGALSDGAFAFSDRAGGNMSRPFYPDGILGTPPGPFSKPFASWSPFSVGLQLDLAYNQIALHVAHYLNQRPSDGLAPPPTGLALFLDGQLLAPAPTAANPIPLPDIGFNCSGLQRLPNGIQIFPGSVPIYRGEQLVGGIGVSGDGIDQDDMVSFLGLHNAGVALGGAIGNAPTARRADQLVPRGARLRYVQCPQAPFLDSTEQNVCEGK